MVPRKRGADEVVENSVNGVNGVNEYPFEQSRKKQRREQHSKSKFDRHQQVGPPATITSAWQLRKLLTEYNDVSKVLHGVQSFKEFLKGYLSSEEEEDIHGRAEKLRIIAEYLNGQHGGREGSESWNNLLQAWSFALQSNNNLLLSWIPTVLEQLLKIVNMNPDLKKQGSALARSIIDASYMKIFYRALSHGSDPVCSPCLRLLTQINKVDEGSLCPSLYQALDFTVKDIGKKLEPKTKGDKVEPLVESPDRPSVRTVFVRFILSFLRYGTTAVKIGIMGVKALITPLFKYLKADITLVLKEVLDALSAIVSDKDIPRSAKSNFINFWVLLRIADLYGRSESVTVGGEERDISGLCHKFLLSVCTTPGNGICYQDAGWYAPQAFAMEVSSTSEKNTEDPSVKQVHNRALSAFISHLRPHADESHLELIVAIFKVCPELVAKYFKDTESFNFDPKLTATWIGFCAFLSETIRLPVERGFNPSRSDARAPSLPPSATMILENILPKPLTRATTTKCLAHESLLVRFLTMQLLNLSFSSLSAALRSLEDGASQVVDSSQWGDVRFTLVEEFSKVIPDMASVFHAFNKAPEDGQLQREAATKLLRNYYNLVPEVAFAHNIDLTSVLTKALEDNDGGSDEGLKVLVLKNLLSMAKDVPDVKWWSKFTFMKYSPFVSVVKFSLDTGLAGDSDDVNEILTSCARSSYLFQTETLISPLDALLQSLKAFKSSKHIDVILQYLDDCSMRCVRTPFKYLDEYAELAINAAKQEGLKGPNGSTRVYLKPVSPILMVLAEQWKFLLAKEELNDTVKETVGKWVANFVEYCYLLGENPYVLGVLATRLSSSEIKHHSSEKLQESLQKWEDKAPEISTKKTAVGKLAPLSDMIGSWIGAGASLNTAYSPHSSMQISMLDLKILWRASAVVTLSSTSDQADAMGSLWGAAIAAFQKALDSKEVDQLDLKRFVREIIDEFSFLCDGIPCADLQKLGTRLPLDLALTKCMALFASVDGLPVPSVEAFLNYYVAFGSSATNGMVENLERLIDLYISRLLSSADIEKLIDRSAYLPESNIRSTALECSVSTMLSKARQLPPSCVRSLILNFRNLPDSVYDILTDHLVLSDDSTSAELLRKNGLVIRKLFFGGPASTRLACKIMFLVPELLQECLKWVTEKEGDLEKHLIPFTATALRYYAEFNTEYWKYQWRPDVNEAIKSELETILGKIRAYFVQNSERLRTAMGNEQILSIVSRAASVCPAVDLDIFLEQLTKPSVVPLEASTLKCYEALYLNNAARKLSSQAMTAFMNRLTRTISDPNPLDKGVAAYAKALGEFIVRHQVKLAELIPRSMLNALLEASLTVRIGVPELDYLVAAIISESPAKDLDHSKFLQLILSHNRSPCLENSPSSDEDQNGHVYLGYAVDRLFSFSKAGHSSVATLDGVFKSYRGTCDPVDQVLLGILDFIESHLSRSCAARVSQWKIGEKNDGSPLVSRDGKNQFKITLDPTMVKRSMWKFNPKSRSRTKEESGTLDGFVKRCEKSNEDGMDQVYDLGFFIPAAAYCLVSETQEIDVQSLVDKNCVGLVMMGLSSEDAEVRSMSEAFLGALAAKLESSHYRERTQIQHLVAAVLASLDGSSAVDIKKEPLPTVICVFLANCVSVLAQPTHFLYEKVMNMLLKKPFVDFNDIPILQSLLFSEGDYQKEVGWILRVLAAGLKTERDLAMYSRRKVFENVQSMYGSVTVSQSSKEKILEMLWAAADVEGGATTLITRNGTLSFIQQLLANDGGGAAEGERLLLKRLAARLYEGSDKAHVKEWSGGGIYFLLRDITEA